MTLISLFIDSSDELWPIFKTPWWKICVAHCGRRRAYLKLAGGITFWKISSFRGEKHVFRLVDGFDGQTIILCSWETEQRVGFTNETFRIHVTILASVSIKKELLNHICNSGLGGHGGRPPTVSRKFQSPSFRTGVELYGQTNSLIADL